MSRALQRCGPAMSYFEVTRTGASHEPYFSDFGTRRTSGSRATTAPPDDLVNDSASDSGDSTISDPHAPGSDNLSDWEVASITILHASAVTRTRVLET
jgi:hypothetical protein